MSQYWKENSLAINHDDNIIYVESAPTGTDQDIRLKITSCDHPNPKVHYRCALTLKEAKSLMNMLQDIVKHQEEMQMMGKSESE